ncbi:F0F1 ATP synthase subunit A, partial [bacterium]|nr:F0F1 ATP synthase subunit A [bacterium]
YLSGYCQPFFFLLPLNIIGEIAKSLSHCCRLFGNIFGGGIIFSLVAFVIFKIAPSLPIGFLKDISEITSFGAMTTGDFISYLTCAPFVVLVYIICYGFFGLFAGLIQALVFTLLALTYIAELSE